MARRKPMGSAATNAVRGRTGGEALAEATRQSTQPTTKTEEHRPPNADLMVTTVRIRRDQWEALRSAALQNAKERGYGKADASEMIRAIIDAWMHAN